MASTSGGMTDVRARANRLLVAGGATAACALFCVVAWVVLPHWCPAFVMRWSPWAHPVMRAAVELEENVPSRGAQAAADWATASPERRSALAPFLASTDPQESMIAVSALADLNHLDNTPEVDAALLPLLKDPCKLVRQLAAQALTDVGSLPALQALALDNEMEVAIEVQKAIGRLQTKADAR